MNWRELNQNRRKRPTTAVARKRKWKAVGQMAALLAVVILLVTGSIAGIIYSQQLIDKVQSKSTPTPLRNISFVTDGMLNRDWLVTSFPHVLEATPLSLDIAGLKRDLEATGQIRQAQVAIILPDTLQITLQERQPVLRARVRERDGSITTLLIANDGTVFTGHGYPAAMLQRLPVAADLRLRRHEGRFLPVAGMEVVTRLIDSAKIHVPHLAADWQTIHFGRLQQDTQAPDALITIGGRQVQQIVFAPGNFEDQLLRLREVVNHAAQENRGPMRRIDLSFREKAVVQFN
ncbi:MAG: hypothetical protein LR015_15640 [Verrucomicrobia bacterium]|nr:hypothetical protein [Verrucomicrobiota bacterium]